MTSAEEKGFAEAINRKSLSFRLFVGRREPRGGLGRAHERMLDDKEHDRPDDCHKHAPEHLGRSRRRARTD